MYPDNLVSLNLEKHLLAGIIRHPSSFTDIDHIISEKEIFNKIHRHIYAILRDRILNNKPVDKAIICQRISEVGIKSYEDINIVDYVDDLSYIPVNREGVLETAKELIKLRIKRDLWDNAEEVKEYVKSCGNKNKEEIIRHVETIYNSQIFQLSTDEEPVDLYSCAESFLREIAKNPRSEVGLETPFPMFNAFFGGLRAKDGCYNIISRSGEGKSCFLYNMAKGVAKINKCKVLYLDTEMSLDLNIFRSASMESKLSTWLFETGNWILKDQQTKEQVYNTFKKFDDYKGHLFHKFVPNKNIDEILSIIRHWFYKYVGTGNKAMVVYDYLKIASDFSENRKEWQQLGDKISYLNEIAAKLDIPLFSAGQQNRSAEQQDGQRNDSSTTAAASDRINQYVAFNAAFRAKTLDELNDHGPKFGTHLLKPFKFSRTQGNDPYLLNEKVKVYDPVKNKQIIKQNFLNYKIDHYSIEEVGDLKKIVADQALNGNIQPNAPPHHNHI